MYLLVVQQVSLATEGGATRQADALGALYVHPHVSLQVLAQSKRAVAARACVRLQAGVQPAVHLQLLRSPELLLADGAREWEIVGVEGLVYVQ